MIKVVYTENKGKLTTLKGFKYLRGEVGLYMGEAKDKDGKVYDIFTESCGRGGDCNCAARALTPVK